MTAITTIRYIDAPDVVEVETPVRLNVSWGDRSRPGRLAVWTDYDADHIRVTVGEDGAARAERGVSRRLSR